MEQSKKEDYIDIKIKCESNPNIVSSSEIRKLNIHWR